MSATGRGAARHPDDHYVTPTWCVYALLEQLTFIRPTQRVLDPGCGGGGILRAVESVGHPTDALFGVELDPHRADEARAYGFDVLHHDFLTSGSLRDKASSWVRERTEAVIMNPPYKLALPFVQLAQQLCMKREGDEFLGWKEGAFVAALLRVGFVESAKRKAWWQNNPADMYVLSKRPSFCHSFKCEECGARATQPVSVGSLVCPDDPDHGRMRLTKSDSSAYAWFVWGPGPRGRWGPI